MWNIRFNCAEGRKKVPVIAKAFTTSLNDMFYTSCSDMLNILKIGNF